MLGDAPQSNAARLMIDHKKAARFAVVNHLETPFTNQSAGACCSWPDVFAPQFRQEFQKFRGTGTGLTRLEQSQLTVGPNSAHGILRLFRTASDPIFSADPVQNTDTFVFVNRIGIQRFERTIILLLGCRHGWHFRFPFGIAMCPVS